MNKLKILSVAVFLIPALWSEAQCMETQIKEEYPIKKNKSISLCDNYDKFKEEYMPRFNNMVIPGLLFSFYITQTQFNPLQGFAVSASATLITWSMIYVKRCTNSCNTDDYPLFNGFLYSAFKISALTTLGNALYPFLSEKDIENMLILDQLKKAGL